MYKTVQIFMIEIIAPPGVCKFKSSYEKVEPRDGGALVGNVNNWVVPPQNITITITCNNSIV